MNSDLQDKGVHLLLRDERHMPTSVRSLAGHTYGRHIANASHGRVIPKAAQGCQSPETALRQSRVFAACRCSKQFSCCGFWAIWMPAQRSSISLLST